VTWQGNERRNVDLSEEQIKAIADAAAKQALEIIYAEVGRSAVSLVLKVLGLGAAALLAYLGLRGKL